MTHYVYFAWDAQRRCLYVGCTNNLARRMREHEQSSPWWKRAAVMAALPYESKALALEVESRQIGKLRPRSNVRDNPAVLMVSEAMAREQWSIDFDDLNGDTESRAAYLSRNPDASGNLRRWIAMQDLRDARALARQETAA